MVLSRTKDYYFKLFDEELSIVQALLDNTSSFWIDSITPRLRLCAAILGVFPHDDSASFSRWHHSKLRLDDMSRLYNQKRLLWVNLNERSECGYGDLPLDVPSS